MLFRLLLAVLLLVLPADAAEYYVATNGKDTNPGTKLLPWRTVQKAADSLTPGDTAFIRRGVYKGRVDINVSGSAPDQWITIRAYPGEKPAIDGNGLVPPDDDDSALINIRDRSYVRIQGLDIRNYRATKGDATPTGVFVVGESHHIEILGNRVHGIAYNKVFGNALGIAVYGTSVNPLHHVVIDGNEVDHCQLGSSESMVLNGNVTEFAVTNNRVHDNNNIGIDFAGYEETCPDPAQDRARDGICRGNLVYNIRSYGNPAYGRNYAAGGIYVDGGTRILIEHNTTRLCDIGIELASEHFGRTTSEIEVRENIIYSNRLGGIFLGGYDELRGGADACFVHHNTLYRNDTLRYGNGEVYLNENVTDCTITHNILSAGTQGLLVGNLTTSLSGNLLDYNLYFSAGKAANATWQWLGDEYAGFAEYRTQTGNDAHSLFADPRFVRALTNFHLKDISPARDAGDPAYVAPVEETDLDFAPRVNGLRTDIGTDEF